MGKGEVGLTVPVEVVDKPRSFSRKYTTQCEGTYAVIRNTCFTIGETLDQTTLNPFLSSWQMPNVGCVDSHVSKRARLDTSVAPISNPENLVDHLERLTSLHKSGDLEKSEFARAKALL